MRATRSWIVAFELADVTPRLVPSKPNIYVSVYSRATRTRQEAVDRKLTGMQFYKPWLRQPLDIPEIATGFPSKRDAAARLVKLKYELARQGFSVNPHPRNTYKLYVVRLDAGKAGHPDEQCLYVGQTNLPIKHRFEQHLNGIRAAKKAHAFQHIDYAFTPVGQTLYSSWNAKVEEFRLGEKLQAEGFIVFGPKRSESGLPDS